MIIVRTSHLSIYTIWVYVFAVYIRLARISNTFESTGDASALLLVGVASFGRSAMCNNKCDKGMAKHTLKELQKMSEVSNTSLLKTVTPCFASSSISPRTSRVVAMAAIWPSVFASVFAFQSLALSSSLSSQFSHFDVVTMRPLAPRWRWEALCSQHFEYGSNYGHVTFGRQSLR